MKHIINIIIIFLTNLIIGNIFFKYIIENIKNFKNYLFSISYSLTNIFLYVLFEHLKY